MTRLLLPLALVALAACGPASTATPDSGTPDAGGDVSITIPFKAKVGTRDFACGQTYMLGTTSTQYQPKDFRLYVHDVALTDHDGRRLPVTLTPDGTWQGQGVALLDFEDASGACSNGTAATNTVLKGTVAPAAHYHMLHFKLGVPFALNHRDATAAEPPLNTTALFWNWMGGYKFLRADGNTTGLPTGYNLHLGSTGCVAGSAPNSVDHCDNPNVLQVNLDFDLGSNTVVVDLGAVLADSNLDTNADGTPPGCMSSPTDEDCAPIFRNLGLPFGATPGDMARQKLFRVE